MSSRSRRSLLGLIAGVLLASVVFFYWTERRIDHAQRAAAAVDLEDEVRLLSRALVIGDPAALDAKVDLLSKNLPFRITVTDPAGKVLADSEFSGEELRRLENHGNRAEFMAAARGETGSRFRYSTSTGRWLLYAAAPLESGEGFIRLAVERPPDPWISAELRLPLLGLLTCMVLLGLVFLVPFISSLSRAKGTLTTALETLGGGAPVTAVPVSSDEELGSLARAAEVVSVEISRRTAGLESECNHLTAVFSSMTEAVLVSDSRGRISKVNRAFHEIFEVERDPIGRTLLEVVRNSEIQAGMEAALNNRQTSEVETNVGGKILIVRFAPIASQGDPSGIVVVAHDITTLRQLESLRKDFISNVSHELKTPLTSIEGYSETLLLEQGLTPLQRSFVAKIHRHAQGLSEMLEDLFRLSQLQNSANPFPRSRVALGKFMRDLESEFSERFAEKGVALRLDVEPGLEEVTANEQHLKRVVSNLIENALRYTEKGHVRVEARNGSEDILFSVSDTGIGIPAEDLGRIFERFYRVAKDRSRHTGGAGVGLALVKHIVQLHGGKVWAESKLGQGTTVFFRLPRE